jgi:hypothetical protein
VKTYQHFIIYGRPKNEAIDAALEKTNHFMREFDSGFPEVLYDTQIGTMNLNRPLEMSDEQYQDFVNLVVKTYEEKLFSGVRVKPV